MKELMRNKVFRIVAAADLLQQAAIWIRNIALLFYIMEQTGNDPVAVSLLTVFEYLPIFLFSFIGGTLADRWNPKKTMIIGDFLSSVSIAVILLFVAFGWWQAVFAATIVSAVVSQFSQPSSAIMFKRHIPDEQVSTAIGITQSLMSLFVIVGPMIGTLVYTMLGIETSLILLIALFLISSLIQLALPNSSKIKADPIQRSILGEMKEGLSYVRRSRNLLVIAVSFAFIGLGSGIIQPLDVYIVIDRLQLAKEDIQWFYVLSGIGMLVGGGAAAMFAHKLNPKVVTFIGIAFLSISIVVEVLSVWVALTATMRLLVGVMMAFMQIVLSSIMIKSVDEAYVGRVSGTITPIIMAGMLLGSSMSGVLMNSITLIPTYCLAAGIIFIAALSSLKFNFKENNKVPAA
ncbi:MFS transporter [Paenibacillus eucommiae]|uniref:MFS family permease n=1 Tax=Paenibacillus eucommiae TaxID=1355755 RepID=A0ABS4IX57_9BACL|nr:MFS family permease [Paenibacillus eucommiae]